MPVIFREKIKRTPEPASWHTSIRSGSHIIFSIVVGCPLCFARFTACIVGHKKGDEFLIDSMGVVLPHKDGKGICIMALTKIWW
jgi:hypothetical protein